MKIALIQQHAAPDRADNIARGLKAMEVAAANGAKLVAYPELAFDLFLPQHRATPGALDMAESIPGPITEAFSAKARELGVVVESARRSAVLR